eukprot:CAMPEP_0178600294 /NCGR_PEP_ID=MMETSP0697-20121206/33777_1 /TAXON_ID=265572 /ORGANISM="Extubocellulus spinifer, Strain CCMP396" /LENGTH=499 /DNA_ID=CAMNT_0020238275 /DNA_START=226 /DNA_END=1725 /DNA_ORIENTATION=+
MPPNKDETSDAPPINDRTNTIVDNADVIESVEEINAALADCSMSSVTSFLDRDEVDRLVHEAPQSRAADNDQQGFDDGLRNMSISSEVPTAGAADHQRGEDMPIPSAPLMQERIDSPVIGDGQHDPVLSQQRQRRPYDDVAGAGPALDPVPFPLPQYDSARRVERVLCYDESTGDHFFATNVLIRVDIDDRSLRNVDRAYWKIPQKANTETRMGHLEHCHVLKRMTEADDDVVFVLSEELVAIKVNYGERMQAIANQPPSSSENPLVEAAALRMVGTTHPHVIGSIQTLYDGDNLFFVLPYCDGGDLHDLVVDYQRNTGARFGLPESQARRWFRDLLKGVEHLHSLGLCHRDLSPENVIIKTGNGAVIDLGMCLRVPRFEEDGIVTRRLMNPQGRLGKLPYMSPDIYRNADAFDGYAIDMWCCGTILFFLITGTKYEHPYDPVFNAMTSDMAGLLPHWGIHVSPEAADLMQRLITIDPRHRLTLDEALTHPWVQQTDQT